MNARYPLSARTVAVVAGVLSATAASAEILFMEGGNVASVEAGYAFAHPSLRSVVFITPEARQMAILPPAPVFIQPPPLLWRVPSPFPQYPPAGTAAALNASSRPSNRDVTTYHLQRAHGFSQELFYRDTYLNLGTPAYPTYWNNSLMPAYPPPAPGSSRPSNRDNTTYNLERAHRFSMDAYKKP
ncbi:MAG: hypothetical protein Q7U97_10355 [Rhodocyclaceae bacterium]|jgi:hypothetical protein|nr:hypothetical protein [Rhodocyclaceae bacterium]